MQSILDTDQQPVTAVICHLVKPGKEQAYEQWLHDISAVAQQFDGHADVNFIRPENPQHPEYVIILKFNCYANLKTWMESEVRKKWIEKAKPLVQQDQQVQILTGLETWFTVPGKPHQAPPKRYKMAILTSVGVFAIAQLLGVIVAPLLHELPPLLRSFLLTALTVVLLTYVVMPRITRLFYRWLYPK